MKPGFTRLLRWRTLVAVLVIPLAALGMQWMLREINQHFIWFFFWVAVFLSTWIGNRRDGFLGTLTALMLVWWFFVPEPYSLIKSSLPYYLYALVFVGIGYLLGLLHHRLRKSRQRIVELLLQLEHTHQILLDSLPDGVFVAQDYRFVFCNPAMPAILGYSKEEFIGLGFSEVVAPEFLELWTRRFEQRIGEGPEPEKYYEVKFMCKDGSSIWVELRASRTQFHDRPAVLGIIHDISDLKRHMETLRLAEAVFHNTQEALVVTDLEANILAINPAFSVITEYASEEIIGKNIRILQSGRQDKEFYRQMWQEIEQTGSWQGAIWNRRKSGDIYQEWLMINTVRDESGEPIQYVGISLDISRMEHVESVMEHLAHHDALTGLPNRLLLHSRLEHSLEQAKRNGRQCAVLFLDLDGFKQVNDTLGHKAGDQLLQRAAERMQARLREVDTLSRLGGDEFVVVLDGMLAAGEAEHVAQALLDALAAPFSLERGEHTVSIGISAGIALFPAHGATVEALINNADAALYEAKKAGKGTWRFFRPMAVDRGS